MINDYHIIRITFLVLFLLVSCKKEPNVINSDQQIEKMVLIYMAANNNLRLDADKALQQIKNSYEFNENHKLLVFITTSSNKSYLLNVKGNNQLDTVNVYSGRNSADPLFLAKVITDSRTSAPALSYGLILWSHGTSWKPFSAGEITTKSFGLDERKEMDLKDLADYLPKDFEYIGFDACSMASIEVIYELRKHADFIIASPTEILSTGFPYNYLVNDLFSGKQGLVKVAEKFHKYYNVQEGLFQSATISLIDASKLDEVAIEVKRLLEFKKPVYPFNKSKIQELTFDTSNNISSYDLLSFLKRNYTAKEYGALEKSIKEAVIYKNYTSSFLGIEISEYCGISIYLPERDDKFSVYYKGLRWSEDSGWYYMFERYFSMENL